MRAKLRAAALPENCWEAAITGCQAVTEVRNRYQMKRLHAAEVWTLH